MAKPTIEKILNTCDELKDEAFRDRIPDMIDEAQTIITVDLSELCNVEELVTLAPTAIELLWTYKARELSYIALNEDRLATEIDGSHKENLYRGKYETLLQKIRNGDVLLPLQDPDDIPTDIGSISIA